MSRGKVMPGEREIIIIIIIILVEIIFLNSYQLLASPRFPYIQLQGQPPRYQG